jgi:hypothetical protein
MTMVMVGPDADGADGTAAATRRTGTPAMRTGPVAITALLPAGCASPYDRPDGGARPIGRSIALQL